MLVLLIIYFVVCVNGQSEKFQIPDVLVEALSPSGLRVSIPDKQGIKGLAFYGIVNMEKNKQEDGFFGRTILEAKNGRWTYYNPNVKLNIGDTLYYLIQVGFVDDLRGYPLLKDNQTYVVTDLQSDCKETATTVNNSPSCSRKLIFHEEFDFLSSQFWTREVKFAGSPDYEFVTYVDRDENLKISNGRLTIKPTITDDIYGEGFTTKEELNLGPNCTGIPETLDCVQKAEAWQTLPPVLSARISTKNKFSFKYGTIEIRAKLPEGNWIYPELYLNARDEEYGPGYESGQIVVAFTAGNVNTQTLYGGGVLGISPKARFYALRDFKMSQRNWTDEPHRFAIVWNKESIAVRIDDAFISHIYPPKNGFADEQLNLGLKGADKWRTGTSLAPFDKEMYITVGVGVGGHWFLDTEGDSKPWKNYDPKGQKKFYKAKTDWNKTWNGNSDLEIDYIKIWAL